MQLRFLNASGDCQFSDGVSSSAPYVGMTYDGMGPAIIATGESGCATIEVDGRQLDVPPRACVRIDPAGARRYRSRLAEDARTIIGRLWARIHEDRDWDQGWGSGGGGVRG